MRMIIQKIDTMIKLYDCKKCVGGKVKLDIDGKNIDNGFTVKIKKCDNCKYQYHLDEILDDNGVKPK